MLPENPRVWSAWNYHLMPEDEGRQTVTYNMNILQGIRSPEPICVTLNRPDDLDPETIIDTIEYDHPVFSQQAVSAQRRRAEINGQCRTWFCGAYWGWGFHEDGMKSALDVLEQFEQQQKNEQRAVSRVG